MNIPEIAKKYGTTADERMLVTRLCELAARAFDRRVPQFLPFMSPAERSICERVTELRRYADITFFGGYEAAERTLAVVAPLNCAYEVEFPITVLALDYKGARLGHRDILGAIMGMGIKREKIGDIIADASPPLVFCDNVIAGYIIDHIERAGRNRISARVSDASAIPEQQLEQKSFTVKSLRLDSITSEAFSVPRSRAAEIIRQGHVYLNWVECSSASKAIAQDDNITVRGMGKIIIAEIGGRSKKDRIYVTIKRYK